MKRRRTKETTDHVLFLAHQSSMQQIESKSFQGQICFSDQHVSFIDENHWTSAASDCIAMRNLRESLAKMARSSLRFFSSSLSLVRSPVFIKRYFDIANDDEHRVKSRFSAFACPLLSSYLSNIHISIRSLSTSLTFTPIESTLSLLD